MKTHTNEFKNQIKKHGRELDSVITYELENETIQLSNENIISITPHYEGAILKSVMKQLDIISDTDIPLNTIINYQFGVKVRNEEVEDYRDNYDYINFGNYVVYSSEKQEDTNNYKIICYDKMLYSMKDYEKMNITYPISIRNYINAICQHLGLTFKNINDIFANYNKEIQSELYLSYDSEKQEWISLDYTFRDVLDELAQVTASTICINEDSDELEVRYINNTGDTIDEEYLKDINVNFGEQYGPINTIILSRSAGSDNVYLSYPPDLPDSQKNAIEIVDNQIMNWNDRDTYLSDILNKLNGLTYYTNDFVSTGITYFNICDRYTIQIGNNYYSCVMFNNSINITQGLTENIYTDIPEKSKIDYSKADKTDRRIRQTYLIVDKQNQVIESVVSETVDTSNPNSIASKQSALTQRVDTLESKIQEIADITTSGETSYATVDLLNVNISEPITLRVHPTSENISYLYPSQNTFPSNNTYLKIRKIRFHNSTTNENIDYELPDDLLRYNSDIYDEFYLDYDSQTCQITKRCQYNSDGTVSALGTEQIVTYDYPLIELDDGNYTVSILGYNNGYLFVRLMAKNIYTTQFYTRVETDSKIQQSANNITLQVNQQFSSYSTTEQMNAAINLKANEISSVVSTKVGNEEIISKINQSAEQIQIDASKISLVGKIIDLTSDTIGISSTNFSVTTDGVITATSGTIGGFTITSSSLYNNKSSISSNIRGMYIGTNGFNFGDNTYYLKMGALTNHPEASGLNITGSNGIKMNNHSIGGCYNLGTQYISASGTDGVVKCNTIFRAENLRYKDDGGTYRDVVGLYRWFLTGKDTNSIAIRDIYGTAHYFKFTNGVLSAYTN